MKKAHKIQIFKNSDKTKQNISQKVDSGRSMVEMLGVLAVIGVLSVASILGYRFAMAKWRANETVNELNIRAYDIATRFDNLVKSQAKNIEMEMGDTTKLGYPIMARISPQYEDYFEMFVSNVPTDVCKELLNSQWQAPYSIFVGVEEYEASADICEQAENVQLAYEFYKDLSTREEVPEETRHKIQRCYHTNDCKCGKCNTEHELCESTCLTGESCAKDYNDQRWFVCCKSEFVKNNMCCSSITAEGGCCNKQGQCCPPNKPLMDKNGGCHTCEELKGVDVGSHPEYCNMCPNRHLASGFNGRNFCTLCGVPGTAVANKPLFHTNVDSPECFSCDYNSEVVQSDIKSDYVCEKVCPDRELTYISPTSSLTRCSVKCPADKPLRIGTNSCTDCDYEGLNAYSFWQKPSCNEVCSNRTDVNGYCVLKDCPSSKPLKDKNGVCHSCDELNGIDVGSHPEYCAACPKRYLAGGWAGRNFCTLCGVPGTAVANKPLFHTNVDSPECFSCDYNSEVVQSDIKSDYVCEKVCPDRELTYISPTSSYTRCSVKCPADKPLRIGTNSCTDCDYEGLNAYSFWQKPSCNEVCSNRTDANGYCVLKDCPSSKPLKDKNGGCHTCEELKGVDVGSHPEYCAVCPKRYLAGGWAGRNFCTLCGVPGTAVANKPLFHTNVDSPECFSCDYNSEVVQSDIKSDYVCEKVCPDRELTYISPTSSYTRCSVKCPADKPLRIGTNSCTDCNYTGNIPLTWLPDTCEKICPNRITVGNNCAWQGVCSAGYFLGSNNVCYPCNISTDITVDPEKEECNRCRNRTLYGTVCAIDD